jgi:integrase
MPRKSKELPDVAIRRLRHKVNASGQSCKEKYPVGGVSGLYLQCNPPVSDEKTGSRQWILRTLVGSKRKEFGLGGYPSVPTKNAREAARNLLENIKSGVDPVSEKRTKLAQLRSIQAKEITFEAYTRETFIPHEAAGYKGTAQVRRLNQLLRDYVFPHIGSMFFEDITKQDIQKILDPIIGLKIPLELIKKDTGQRVRNYVEAIIQRAISDGLREKANPAVWKNNLDFKYKHLEQIEAKEHRAIHWAELPKFIKAVNVLDKPTGSRPDAQCMIFMILTVSRPQEAILADWKEIDLETKVWHQPKGKYKSKKLDWDIPLCPTAIKILKAQPSYARQRGRIFSTLNGGEFYSAALSSMPDTLGFDAVAHGCTSSAHLGPLTLIPKRQFSA